MKRCMEERSLLDGASIINCELPEHDASLPHMSGTRDGDGANGNIVWTWVPRQSATIDDDGR